MRARRRRPFFAAPWSNIFLFFCAFHGATLFCSCVCAYVGGGESKGLLPLFDVLSWSLNRRFFVALLLGPMTKRQSGIGKLRRGSGLLKILMPEFGRTQKELFLFDCVIRSGRKPHHFYKDHGCKYNGVT